MAFRNSKRTINWRKPSAEQLTNAISELAYQYYVDRGYQSGNDFDDWLRAERTIKAKYNLT